MLLLPIAILYDSQEASSTSTRDALPISKIWFDECSRSHETCQVVDAQRIPARLIDLSGNQIRLRLSTELENCPRYATLSHCWGSLPFQTLKKSTLEDFRKQIPSEALPKTFQDAINTVRYLGLHYLWIDSLCILQDDYDDWAQESSLMSSVYGDSSINIAASGASDASVGCFFARDWSWRCQVQANTGKEEVLYDCAPATIESSLRDAPLAARAWALQERVLPHRTLHFTATQVFWECNKKILCETFPEDLPEGLTECLRMTNGPVTKDNWHEIVGLYSGCKLTHSKDKLVALSGVARLVQAKTVDETGGDYIAEAGMWKKDLELQLCWRITQTAMRISPYTAPSWSWASIDGRVKVPDSAEYSMATYCVKVLDVNMTPAPQGPFREILSVASLQLSCKYFIYADIEGDEDSSIIVAGKSVSGATYFDDFSISENERLKVHIAPVIHRDSRGCASGLMLQPTGEETGQYRRVGYFCFFGKQDSQEFNDAAKSPECQVEDSECVQVFVDKDGAKHCIINIL